MRKNMCFITMVAALVLSGVFLLPSLSWSQTTTPTQYAPGWLARIISVPKDFKITDSLPPMELGRFAATKSKYNLDEYKNSIKGLPTIETVLWVGEAFLKAEEAGYYVFFVVPVFRYSSCRIARAVYVEGNVIAADSGSGSISADNVLMGAAELEPGLYKVEFRVTGPTSGTLSSDKYGFDLRVKGPSDNRPLPISQVLLLPVTKK